jgi:hypothetical protein
MRRVLLALIVSLAAIGFVPAIAGSATATSPTQTIVVTGNGVAMYPAFAQGTQRYGLTTTADTSGTVTVSAATTDAAGKVWVDGQPAANGVATLTGLTSGEEISVFIKDSTGTSDYSLVYLPPGFPAMTVLADQPGIAPGDVFLTLTDFTGQTPGFETAVDNNGVPVYVRTDPGIPTDFKLQPNGNYSVFRTTPPTDRTGGEVVELDSRFKQIATYTTSGLVNTDDHDSILLPNGDRWLLASEPNAVTGNTDAVIQKQDKNGNVLFQWSTADHVDLALDGLGVPIDYAHINSIWLMQNGDILASFRHLSQVMEIATSAHDGFEPGDVVWRLGGRRSTFTFPDDPMGGPCAQHTASQLPNGDILVFDDGSESINGSPLLCVDQSDPTGPTVARPQTRVAEYSLNQVTDTASLVWSYQVAGQDTAFAGSARRLSNGNTLIGWGGITGGLLATEVNAAGDVVWELKDTGNLESYRALKFAAPDAIPPVADVTTPAPGATYAFGQKVDSDFSCTDQGGSNLASCNGSAAEGARINTATPGVHTFSVVAKDGAGNVTTVTRTYHVGLAPPKYQPDASVKPYTGGTYLGGNTYGTASRQHVNQSIATAGGSARALVRLQNDGNRMDRMRIRGTAGTATFQVAYFSAGRDVTRAVVAGTYQTASLLPGRFVTLRIRVTRTAAAQPGDEAVVRLTATSVTATTKHDEVATIVHAIR